MVLFIKSQESVSISKATKAAMAEYYRPDGWIEFDEGEIMQHRRNLIERNATWEMMPFSCPSPTHLLNTISSATATTIATTSASTQGAATVRTMDPTKLMNAHDLNIFIAPYIENGHHGARINHFNNSVINEGGEYCRDGNDESQTLQLFPIRSGGNGNNIERINERETEVSVSTTETLNANDFSPCQFFEFLPLRI